MNVGYMMQCLVMTSARLQRWALILITYQYSIKYKQGHELANAMH